MGGDGRVVLGDMGTCAALELRAADASAPRLARPSLDAAQAYLGRDKFKGTAQYHAPGVSTPFHHFCTPAPGAEQVPRHELGK